MLKILLIAFTLTFAQPVYSSETDLTSIVKAWYEEGHPPVAIHCDELGDEEHGIAECWVVNAQRGGLYDEQHHIWEIQGGKLVRMIK